MIGRKLQKNLADQDDETFTRFDKGNDGSHFRSSNRAFPEMLL